MQSLHACTCETKEYYSIIMLYAVFGSGEQRREKMLRDLREDEMWKSYNPTSEHVAQVVAGLAMHELTSVPRVCTPTLEDVVAVAGTIAEELPCAEPEQAMLLAGDRFREQFLHYNERQARLSSPHN
jgi:hypothetical protein